MIHKIKYFVLFFFFFIISCTTDLKRTIKENIQLLEISRTEDPISFSSYIKNESTEIRLQVVNTIAKIGSNNHLNLLKEFLNDKSPKVINASIFALGQIKDNKSENLLLKLLNSTTYNKFQQQIIKSLGVSGTSVAIKDILSLLPSFSDSLKYHAIQSICFIYSRNAKSDFNPLEIQKYLTSPSEKIRTAAAYFFVRNPNSSVIKNLIRTKFTGKSIGYKYRMQALDRGLADYYIQDTDSIIFDSLKNDILHQINRKTSSWQLKLHILSLLANYPDTESVNHISKFLHHQNPHIRLKSITLLDKISLPETKNPLLRFYEKASWMEKGSIILALAGKDSLLAHRLIQQNLDQGTTYFKQLLLRSLAKIADETSIQQLRQFLIVPDKRLKFTAFDALSDLNYLTYDDVKTFLDSGDLALATLAANYLSEHPEIINLDDLILAYNNIPDTGDNDAQLAILDLLESLQNKKSREFLLNIYIGTSNRFIANKTRRLLEKFNVKIPTKTTDISKSSLPFEIMNSQDPVNISIKTEKGIIEIELWPDISPITVSNFVKLTNEDFYNNITFHRVIGDFVIQGGDPRGDGWGGPGYSIPCEYNNKPFIRGSVGMATAGKDTGGSQFFICHSPQPHLNRRYTVFGHVIKGMDIVDIIEKDDKILEIITN